MYTFVHVICWKCEWTFCVSINALQTKFYTWTVKQNLDVVVFDIASIDAGLAWTKPVLEPYRVKTAFIPGPIVTHQCYRILFQNLNNIRLQDHLYFSTSSYTVYWIEHCGTTILVQKQKISSNSSLLLDSLVCYINSCSLGHPLFFTPAVIIVEMTNLYQCVFQEFCLPLTLCLVTPATWWSMQTMDWERYATDDFLSQNLWYKFWFCKWVSLNV